MTAFELALFLVGVLVGSVVGGTYVLKEHMRRYHVHPGALRRLAK